MDNNDHILECESCGKEVDGELHTCPYSEEITGDDTECNCCSDCQNECCMEI